MSELRGMLHLIAADAPALVVARLAEAAADHPVTVLTRADDCFIRAASPHAASVELRAPADDLQEVIDSLVAVADALGDTVDRDTSMAVVGTDIVFVPVTATARRFQYLMRRRSDFSHDDYLHRYQETHSKFGVATPNIDGYIQHHVDLALSERLGRATGLLQPACDSVSELYIRAVPHFIDGILANPEIGQEAQKDEERFVDREHSFGFVHAVLQE